jgi:hypothetical protein
MTQPDENAQNTENKNQENVTPPGANQPKKLSYEELEAELRNVRNEAASRRITNRELEQQAQKWKEYEDSQKTELQKLQEAVAERDKKLSTYELKEKKFEVAKEFGLDVEDADLLTGSDEATIRKQAERLQARLGNAQQGSSRPADLLAGNRGTPIGGNTNTNPEDDLIRRMARGR